MLEIPERVYEECQVKLQKATVKSHETIMLTLHRGVPLRQYDPKLIRARPWFEGVSTPRNGQTGVYGRKLRSNKHQGQVHPNVKRKIKTSPAWREREDGGICSHHTHDAGERCSKKKNRANLQRFCELIL